MVTRVDSKSTVFGRAGSSPVDRVLLVLGLPSLENQFDEVSGPDCEFETAAVVPR